MNEENDVLSVNVADAVGTLDVGPGGAPPPAKAEEEEVRLVTERFVAPHTTRARTVTDADLVRLKEEAEVMHRLCFEGIGLYPSALAIAHTQIEDKDPLRVFVTATGEIIINPRIINHTKVPVDHVEGCMTYPERDPITVRRYHVVDLEFQTLTTDLELTPLQVKTFSGKVAKIVQHEVAHLNGHYVYDDGASPEDCIDKAGATA